MTAVISRSPMALTEGNQNLDVDNENDNGPIPTRNDEIGHKHPSEYLDKLEFLTNVELMTHESFKETQHLAYMVKRRRRTSNPKYNSGFIDPSVLYKRKSKKDDFGHMKLKRRARSLSAGGQDSKNDNNCFVCEVSCEKLNFGCCKLTCGNCSTAFHSDCIRVGGSKAPLINRVQVCPNCIQQLQQKSRAKMDHNSIDSKSTSACLPLSSPNKILNDMKSNIRLNQNQIVNRRPKKYAKREKNSLTSSNKIKSKMPKLKSNLDTSSNILKKKKIKREVENGDLITGESKNKSTIGTAGAGSSKSKRSVKRSPTPGPGFGKAFTFIQELTEADLKKTIISMTEAAKYVLENAKSNNLSPTTTSPCSTSTASTTTENIISITEMTEAAKYVLENAKSNNLTPTTSTCSNSTSTVSTTAELLSPVTFTHTKVEELKLQPNTNIKEKVLEVVEPSLSSPNPTSPVSSTSITVSSYPAILLPDPDNV